VSERVFYGFWKRFQKVMEEELRKALDGWVTDKVIDLVISRVLHDLPLYHFAVVLSGGADSEEKAKSRLKELEEFSLKTSEEQEKTEEWGQIIFKIVKEPKEDESR